MAKLNWFPINPLRKDDGSFQSLASMKDSSDLKPVPLDKKDDPFAQFKVMQNSLNVQTASDLGVSVGSINANFKSFCLSYEAMLFTEKIVSIPMGGQIYGTRWGAGLRVLLKVSDIETKSSFKFGSVAAAAQLGLAKVEYEITGIGISDPAILKVLPGPGEFNFENYNKIIAAADSVKQYMADNPTKLNPEPFQVFMSDDINKDVFKDSQSVLFAARNVMSRNTLAEALANAKNTFNAEIITGFYGKMGIFDSETKPTRDDKQEAQSFLDV